MLISVDDRRSAIVILRNGVSIALLAFSWLSLSRWYSDQLPREYFLFLLSFVPAALLAGWPFFRFVRGHKVGAARLAIAGAVLFLSLPWGEWLRLGPSVGRELWTRQLFWNFAFLYACLIAFQLFPPAVTLLSSLLQRATQFFAGKRILFWLPVLLFFCLTVFIAFFIYDRTVIIQDSAAHLFQAKIFKHGKLFAPVPPVPEFFSTVGDMLVMKNGKWFEMYQPGLAILLAFAMLVRAEWLLCPLLGALTICIWMAYARRWYGARAGALFGWLALLSPFLFLMSSSIMVHVPELFVVSGVIYICRAHPEEPRRWHLPAVFLLLAVGALVRSFSALPFLAPVLADSAWQGWKKRTYSLPLTLAAGATLGLLILFYYQYRSTANPLVQGYLLEYPDVGWGFGWHFAGEHTPLKGLENTSNNFLGMNHWLTGWYSGSLVFILWYILFARGIDRWDKLLAGSAVCLMLVYFCFYFQDLFFGPRFLYPLAPLLLLMICRIVDSAESEGRPAAGGATLAALLVVCLVSFLPAAFPAFMKKYDVKSSVSEYLKEEIRKTGSQKTLAFLEKGMQKHYVNWNDPFLRDPVIILLDKQQDNARALAAFPGYRPVYFRMALTMGKLTLKREYRFMPDRSQKGGGFLSMFELGMAMETAAQYPGKDFFDICYSGVVTPDQAPAQYSFLEKQEREIAGKQDYRSRLHLGLIHSGRLLLLPAVAYDKLGRGWERAFNKQDFRNEYNAAVAALRSSGETGKGLLDEYATVSKRIDKNQDGYFSDAEISAFLAPKMSIFFFGK